MSYLIGIALGLWLGIGVCIAVAIVVSARRDGVWEDERPEFAEDHFDTWEREVQS